MSDSDEGNGRLLRYRTNDWGRRFGPAVWLHVTFPRLYDDDSKARKRLTGALPMIILISVVLAFALLFLAWHQPVSYSAKNDYVRTIAQVGAACALLMGLWFTHKTLQNSVDSLNHQRVSEQNERFFKAVEQLGRSEATADTRVGAIYALRRYPRI